MNVIEDINIGDIENEIPSTAIVDINDTQLIFCPKPESFKIDSVKNKTNEFIIEDSISNNAILDMKKICRVCLKEEIDMVSLFSVNDSEVLANMFFYISSIEIKPEENLPVQVCTICQRDIMKYYNFKLKCNESNSFLTSFITTDTKERISQLSYNKSVSKETQTTDTSSSLADREIDNDIKKEEDITDIEYLEEEILNTEDLVLSDNEGLLGKSKKKVPENIRVKAKPGIRNKQKKQLQCDICSKTFLKTKTLKAHIVEYHSTKTRGQFPCKQCKESFNSEHDLLLHSALHVVKDNKWFCNKCNKEFMVKNGLRRHIRRHMEWKRYACDTCGKSFSELCALRRHVRVHTGERVEKKYQCDVCDKRFIDRSQLSTHMAAHTGECVYACELCGKTFRSGRLLDSHRRVHSDLKPYGCNYCDKRFRHESTRNTHHRTHTGEKPYVCCICGKTFIQHSNLTLHMRTHTGEKPYTCDICSRKFSSGSSLTCHRRTHTGEKPYGCPVCGKRFARTDIRTHLRQHTGEKPFSCCACPKSFTRASSLRDHSLIHTGEKAFECAICSEKFVRKSYLAKHLKSHEGDKVKNKVIVLPLVIGNNIIVTKNNSGETGENDALVTMINKDQSGDIMLEVNQELPIEVAEELILDDSDVKNEVIVGDEGQHPSVAYQTRDIPLNSEKVEFENQNDINLVTVDENGISETASIINGTPVKLYQVDQSLVEIETLGGQLTIRKITSKTTANF